MQTLLHSEYAVRYLLNTEKKIILSIYLSLIFLPSGNPPRSSISTCISLHTRHTFAAKRKPYGVRSHMRYTLRLLCQDSQKHDSQQKCNLNQMSLLRRKPNAKNNNIKVSYNSNSCNKLISMIRADLVSCYKTETSCIQKLDCLHMTAADSQMHRRLTILHISIQKLQHKWYFKKTVKVFLSFSILLH